MTTRRLLSLLFATFSLTFASFATNASAVQVGSQCAAATGSTNATWVEETTSAYVIPINGVITKWGFTYPGPVPPFPVRLMTVSGAAPNFTVTGVSSGQLLASGAPTFTTSMKATAGERIGMTDTPIGCASLGSSIASFTGSVAPGQSYTSDGSISNTAPSVWAQVEADADGDGFGDETQDLCSISAQIQAACPTPVLGVSRFVYAKGFLAYVTTDFATTVTVTGSVKLPGKRKATAFKSKAFKTSPGVLTKVTLKLPRPVTSALKSLSKRKKLNVAFTTTADGVVKDTAKKFNVSFPGKK